MTANSQFCYVAGTNVLLQRSSIHQTKLFFRVLHKRLIMLNNASNKVVDCNDV
jgi:hypothetical protein